MTRRQARTDGVPVGGEVLPPTAPQPAPADAVTAATPTPTSKPSDAVIAGDPVPDAPVPDAPRKAPTLYDKDHPKQ